MARGLLPACRMRIVALLSALLAPLTAASAAAAGSGAPALAFAPVPGLERAEGASALAFDELRGRLAVGDARGVHVREADGRVRRALGAGPVHDLAFRADGTLLAATERGLYEIGADGRVVRRPLGPGAAGRARRVLPTPVGTFVASDDGILAAPPGAGFRPLDGALPGGEARALAWSPASHGAGQLHAIVDDDLYAATLERRGGGLVASGFVREPLIAHGGAPLDLSTAAAGIDLVVLRRGSLALLNSRGFESVDLALPPGVEPIRLGFGAGRAFLASDGGLLEAPGLAGPWRRQAGAGGGAPASAVVATATRLFVATTRGVFSAELDREEAGEPRRAGRSASRSEPASAARSASEARAESARWASEEPAVGAVQRAALRYLDLGNDRLARLKRRVSRRGLWPELALQGDYGGFHASDRDVDDTVFSSGSRYRLFDHQRERGRDFGVAATLRWDLGDAIYHPEEIDVSKELRELIELRDEVLDEINQLYFERRRVLLERARLNAPASLEAERLALRAQELAAGLDAWTGGWWSRQRNSLSPRVTDPEEERP